MPDRSGRILIVEDDARLRSVLMTELQANGYEPLPVGSGEEALSVARREKPSIILLDVALPCIDGWETLRRLRADRATSAIPVVMLTASSGTDDIIRGYASGATYYVPKPYDLKELLRGLTMALADAASRKL